jgi:hypothetical protein
MDDEKKSLTVSQVNRAIGAALEDQFFGRVLGRGRGSGIRPGRR